jgi:hypothetical protein
MPSGRGAIRVRTSYDGHRAAPTRAWDEKVYASRNVRRRWPPYRIAEGKLAMLQVTDAAVSVLKSEILHEGDRRQAVPATAIRIRPVATDNGRPSLTLQPVMGPEPGDARAEATNLDVFVAPELVGRLDSSVLDAQPTPEGPEILLREQPPTT